MISLWEKISLTSGGGKGGRGSFGTDVRKCWAHDIGGGERRKILRQGRSRKTKHQRTNKLKFSNLFLI
jgi:hypothetical protein